MSFLDRLKLPHPLRLLSCGVAVAAALTWILPSGEFDRRIDPEAETSIVVAGTYHSVDASPIGLMAALIAVPRGVIDGAEIIVLILFVGGAFALLDSTGALGRLVGALVNRVRYPATVVALVSALFATIGAQVNS